MHNWTNIFFSNIGKRENNQDFICINSIKSKRRRIQLMLVCDGVGGRPNGKECSEIVGCELSKQINSYLKKRKSKLSLSRLDTDKLLRIISNLPVLNGLSESRTTVSLLIVDKKETCRGYSCITLWAGDSRIYSVDTLGNAKQISKDQYDDNGHLSVVYTGEGKLVGKLGYSFFTIKDPLLFCITTDGMNSSLKGLFNFFVACVYHGIYSNQEFEYQTTKFLGKLISDNYSAIMIYRKYSKISLARIYRNISLK